MAHFFFELPVVTVLGAELEEVEGLLEDETGVILSGESPPFGIVVFPESLPFERPLFLRFFVYECK